MRCVVKDSNGGIDINRKNIYRLVSKKKKEKKKINSDIRSSKIMRSQFGGLACEMSNLIFQ